MKRYFLFWGALSPVLRWSTPSRPFGTPATSALAHTPRGYFVNQAGAAFDIVGGVNTLSSTFGSTLTNQGAMPKIGPGTSAIMSAAVINHGLLEVQEGALTICHDQG